MVGWKTIYRWIAAGALLGSLYFGGWTYDGPPERSDRFAIPSILLFCASLSIWFVPLLHKKWTYHVQDKKRTYRGLVRAALAISLFWLTLPLYSDKPKDWEIVAIPAVLVVGASFLIWYGCRLGVPEDPDLVPERMTKKQ